MESEYDTQGLYVYGPRGPVCALAFLIAFTWCAISAPTPEGERKRTVTYKGRRMQELREDGLVEPRTTWLGRFPGPTKSPNSGRRKKAA